MSWSPYKEVCDCGHDIATHFREESGERSTCLGMRCECRQYRDHLAPKQSKELETLRIPQSKTLAVGMRVRVIYSYSPHYLKEGWVTRIQPKHGWVMVTFDSDNEYCYFVTELQIL